MKTLTTILLAFAALTLPAQSNEFRIMVSKNQPISTAWSVYGITVHFCPGATNYTDPIDQLSAPVTDSSKVLPYTQDSASMTLGFDARPQLRAPLSVPFGAWTRDAVDMFVQGVWSNPGSENLYDVLITDNINGGTYNLYNECMLPVMPNMSFTTQYTITFVPKAQFIGTNESCFGQANGTIYARSAQPNWTADLYLNNTFLRNVAISSTDTLLTNLATGTYSIVYMLDGVPTDTETVVIGGPAQVVPSATISNSSPLENEQVNFINTSTGALDYDWDFGDGNTSTDVDPSHTYTTAGTYTVTLTAYSPSGCDNSITYVITVNSGAFANSNNGPHYRNNMPGSATARTAPPTVTAHDGQAHIAPQGETPVAAVKVYSLNGQIIYSAQGAGNSYDFSYDAPGIYVAQFTYADGSEYTAQIPLN